MSYIVGCESCGTFPTDVKTVGEACESCGAELRAWVLAPECFTPKPSSVRVGTAPARTAGGDTPAIDDTLAPVKPVALMETELWLKRALGLTELDANELDVAYHVAELRLEVEKLRASLLARQRDGERTTEARLRMLATLADDWDGYGARRTHLGAIESARRLAHVLSESPDIVPTTTGGIQLEWQRGGIEVEIRISPEGDIEPTIDVEVSPPSTERA